MAVRKERPSFSHLGKYEILGTLGRGAMGVVYRARDPEIGREVALKTLRSIKSDSSSDADNAFERFRNEARSAGNLRHPNIITIFEINRDGDTPYLVMDYVQGEPLDQLILRHGRIEPYLLMNYLFQISAGLDHAHEKGVIHRDIKPSNLLVDKNGRVFILDFGVATFNQALPEGGDEGLGPVIGTPGYMSPEQILSQPLDRRSDLFSLAAVAFECLSGKRPFPGETFTEVMGNILHGEVRSLSQLKPELPLALEAEFERALSKSKDQRFESAYKMTEAFCGALGFDPHAVQISPNPAQLPELPRKRKSTGWKSFRSSISLKDRIANDTPSEKQEASEEKRSDYGSPWDLESKKINWKEETPLVRPNSEIVKRPGDIFTQYVDLQKNINEANRKALEQSYSLRRLTLLFAGLCIALGIGLIYLLVSSPDSSTPEEAGQVQIGVKAPSKEQLNLEEIEQLGIGHLTPEEPPVGREIPLLNERQLLWVLKNPTASEQDLITAIQECRTRKLSMCIGGAAPLLKNPSYLVRIETVKLAAEIGDKQIVPELLLLLDDKDAAVRGHTARALGLLGDRKAIGYLKLRYAKEESPEAKAAIRRAIERIQGFPM